MFNAALVSTGIGGIRRSPIKDQAKSYKFNIAKEQSSCSSLSRKIDTAHNKIQPYGGLNVTGTTNCILVTSSRESTH